MVQPKAAFWLRYLINSIGIGERIEDLENFSAPVFAAALSGLAQELDTPDSNN